ncbi:GNAT family N-acetyltransferase [Paenibacillus cellulositrophicus]|uniref:GNAT family N-acetyltransferase n=1 Tax=Paenibacillus cellulositrophicus TaxID=562959 RepID=UPI003D81AB35
MLIFPKFTKQTWLLFLEVQKYGFVRDVYIEPRFRNWRYTRELTNIVLKWFTEQNIRTVRLIVSHNARHLYE